MQILFLILINILILNIWLRITEHIFHISPKDKNTTLVRTTLFVGIFVALSIFIYPYILKYVGYKTLDYTNTFNYPNLFILIALLCYTFIVLLIHKLFIKSLPTKFFLKEYILWIILLGGGYIFFNQFNILPIFIYYFIVASNEEGLKYLTSIQVYKKHYFLTSDLILYALLIALGFAFLENIVYILQSIQVIKNISTSLPWGTHILLSRGIIDFLVHILFTGSIATLSIKALERGGKIISLFGALCIGVALHMSYNILLHYNIVRTVIFYLIAGYFLLTWIFWNSESIYIKNNNLI